MRSGTEVGCESATDAILNICDDQGTTVSNYRPAV